MNKHLPSREQVFRQVPCLCAVVLVAARAVTRLYNEEMRDTGLEVTQHAMLRVLEAVGPIASGDLGERLAIDKTTASRNIKVMVRNGWVALERGKDERERLVTLTKAGRQKMDLAKPAWDNAQKRLREALPAGGFETLRRELPDLALAALAA